MVSININMSQKNKNGSCAKHFSLSLFIYLIYAPTSLKIKKKYNIIQSHIEKINKFHFEVIK